MSASENLESLITKSSCYCLNEDARHPYGNLFVGDHTLFLQSDVDEQLVLQLSFGQTSSLRQLIIGVPNNESCPKSLKLFANHLDLGFSECSDMPATQVVALSPSTDKPDIVTINLQAAKWQRIETLTIFVESNHGAPKSSLHSLKILGNTVFNTNVSNIHNINKDGHK